MIETKYGKLEGIHHGWYAEYLGVPYAKPPVGELRWKAPQQMEPYEGGYRAVQFPNKAVQAEGSSPPWDKAFSMIRSIFLSPARTVCISIFTCPKEQNIVRLHFGSMAEPF